jgi:outer membrane protein TolC
MLRTLISPPCGSALSSAFKLSIALILLLIINSTGAQSLAAVSEAPSTQNFADHLLDSHYDFHGRQVEAINYGRRHLSLLETFNRADERNKEILVASTNLSTAAAAIVIAKAIPNPEFSLVFGWGPAWKYIVAGNNQQAGWEEEILVAGKRTKRTNVAKASYLQTAFQIEATRFDVHNRTRRAYVELAAAAAYAELVEDQRKIAQQLLDISQKRFDAGKAAGSEVMQGRLAVMQFDIQRNQAEGRLVQDTAKLAQLLGDCLDSTQ